MAKYYNNRYVDRTTVRNYNPFAEEYYCGTDINVDVNGKKYPIMAIEYTLQEQLKPIYGYASRVYDDIAIGSRIVVGTMVVPIKNNSNDPVFKNEQKTKGNTPKNFNYTEEDLLQEKRKTLYYKELNNENNSIDIIDKINKDTKLFISPTIKNSFLVTDKEYNINLISELKDHYYIYINDLELNCYIKKESGVSA